MLNRLKFAWSAAARAFMHRSVNFDAQSYGKRLHDWRPAPIQANQQSSNPLLLRARAQDAYRNQAYARKAVDAIVVGVVGASGLNPRLPAALREAWKRFSNQCDASFQSLLLRTVIVSGEAFVIMGVSKNPTNPLQLQLLGPEFLDESRNDRNTRGGIEYLNGKRTAYWLFESTPSISGHARSIRFEASQVLHVFRPLHPGDQRGVSWLAPVLLPFRDLQSTTESLLMRLRVSAIFAGFVRNLSGQFLDSSRNAGGERNYDLVLEPGSIMTLRDGEEFTQTEPPDAGSSVDSMIRLIVRQIASGLNLPYETISGDYSQVTFASGRGAILEWRRHIEEIQHNLLVKQFCQPVFDRWLQLGQALENVPSGSAPEPRWIGPQLEMLDPRGETAAQIARVRAGFEPRSEVIAKTGWDAEDIDAAIAADNQRADLLGLILDSDPRRVTMQGMVQPYPQPDADSGNDLEAEDEATANAKADPEEETEAELQPSA